MAALVDALTRAVPPDDAFVYAFGATIDDIDLQLRKYVRQQVFRGIPIDPGPAHSAGAMTTARMTEAAIAGLRGELLLRVGTLDEAAAELAASLAADSSNVEIRVAIARVLAADGRRDEGRRMLEAAAMGAPDDFAAQYYLGGMLAAQRRYLEAFGYFDRAVRLREHSVSALFAFSSVALALGLDDASDEALRQSMQLESNPEAYRLRAFAALGLGRDDAAAREALRYIDTVGWREASAQATALVAAVAYARSSRPADAAEILERINMAAPLSSWVRAVAQFMQGKLTAEGLLARAKSAEERTAGHTYVGLKAELAGRRDEALWHFRWVKDQGTRQEPGYGVAIEELVRIETDGDR
jgi:tetratricopeptide (TPR) repeat protein